MSRDRGRELESPFRASQAEEGASQVPPADSPAAQADKRTAPPANNGDSKPHGSPEHDAAVNGDIQDMRDNGYTDIRKNQAQVDAQGNKVGDNRPDAQGTRPDGTREIREQDRDPARSRQHGDQIRANDPNAVCILGLLCF